ncbi:hypothetical protein RB8648 [Rhodopirellula baltica SH 1]|uniref:Uncharacterized protein n=1 Tax=Rhodopirellula baltica (strain DSM 10527 / NCIMB 13988 / SH1) TaxID=243090 RepID=Q7UMR3_RHOBA|nr:hypothetical protein RB8648 [Rhodopirellula baltica SH 1]
MNPPLTVFWPTRIDPVLWKFDQDVALGSDETSRFATNRKRTGIQTSILTNQSAVSCVRQVDHLFVDQRFVGQIAQRHTRALWGWRLSGGFGSM